MPPEKHQKPLSYWRIGFQYLHLVEITTAETIRQGNTHVIITDIRDGELTPEAYKKQTQWSDFEIILPVLFNFYHGIEVVLKGFLIAADKPVHTNHKLSELINCFEQCYPENSIAQTIKKYIVREQLPTVLSNFCKESEISIDDYYQALKYPESKKGSAYFHKPLKYNGSNGIHFFKELHDDIATLQPQIVNLGRTVFPNI